MNPNELSELKIELWLMTRPEATVNDRNRSYTQAVALINQLANGVNDNESALKSDINRLKQRSDALVTELNYERMVSAIYKGDIDKLIKASVEASNG